MIPKSGNRFSDEIMPTQKDIPVSVAEAKSLFSDLQHCPVLLLAVSGGPDSTALMLLAARWAKARKNAPKLVAVTVDHGLRPEAAREAQAVARLAQKLGIAHRTLRWRGKKPKTGLQQAARLARYRLLAEAARQTGAQHILTAHTRDDQAETVVIRLTRGSGLTGLAAMQRIAPLPAAQRAPSPLEGEGWGGGGGGGGGGPCTQSLRPEKLPPSRPSSPSAPTVDLPHKGGGEERKDASLCLVRPLLDIPKSRLIATLKAAKIPYAEDPSNRDPRFTRARLRGLMPELAREGLDARRLSLLARRLKRADAAIEAVVDEAMAALAPAADTGRIVLPAKGFTALPDEIALRLIGRAVALTGDEGPVELGKLEALVAALAEALGAAKPAGTRFRRSLAGAMVTLTGGQIAVERAPPRRGKALTNAQRGRAKPPATR
jgi:tRNA(Ile)-lysidine synthase